MQCIVTDAKFRYTPSLDAGNNLKYTSLGVKMGKGTDFCVGAVNENQSLYHSNRSEEGFLLIYVSNVRKRFRLKWPDAQVGVRWEGAETYAVILPVRLSPCFRAEDVSPLIDLIRCMMLRSWRHLLNVPWR